MNHVSILRASFRENRKRAQYKSAEKIVPITTQRKDVPMRDEPLVVAPITPLSQQRRAEKRLDNTHGDANLISHNTKPSTEGQAVSPDAPPNPLWKDCHIRAHFPEKRPNGTFDNGPQEKKFSWRVLLSLLTAFGLAVYSVGKALGAW